MLANFDGLPPLPQTGVPLARRRIRTDVSHDPFDYSDIHEGRADWYYQIGHLTPAARQVPREILYASSLTPKGRFITWVAIQNTFRNGWRFVREKSKTTPLPPRLHDRLVDLTNEYNLQKYFIQAKSLAAIFGQSLLFMRQVNPPGFKQRWKIRATPLWEENIEYDDEGEVKIFRPIIPVGRGLRQFEVLPQNAVVWLANQEDPFGNEQQGIPEHFAALKTIARSESISQNFAEIISQKGLGQLDIEIMNATTQEDVEKWAEIYKKLVMDSVIVHGPQMKAQVTPGISAGYNYAETIKAYFEDTASATGMPQMRMRGVQTGTVTGSETDQDNIAEIYSTIQEASEESMKATYLMLDPGLIGKAFEIDWDFNIKMDVMKRSNKQAQDVNTVLAGADLFTVNEAFEILGKPLLSGPDGDMYLQAWIVQNSPEPAEGPDPMLFPTTRPQEAPASQVGKAPGEETVVDSLIREGEVALDAHIAKEAIAAKLLESGLSTRKVNEVLRVLYKSGGLSNNVLVKIRENG